MKQLELASRMNVTRQAVSRYETGERDIGPNEIRRLCEIFGVTADYLLGFSSVPSPAVSEEDAALLAAYHSAPESVREGIDTLLKPYKEDKKITAAG